MKDVHYFSRQIWNGGDDLLSFREMVDVPKLLYHVDNPEPRHYSLSGHEALGTGGIPP